MNRTLLETLYSKLYDNKVLSRLWAEALQTAVYLRNWAPTSAYPSCKTPIEFCDGRHLYIGHLRVFGSVSHVHLAKAGRKKLESHSHPGLVVGYESTNFLPYLYTRYPTDYLGSGYAL